MYSYLLLQSVILYAIDPYVLLQADFEFGRRQVDQVICDRPGMGPIINREPKLRAALESSFAGRQLGQRVYWDCREPVSGAASEQVPAYKNYPPFVQVSNRSNVSEVDKCVALFRELQNAQ